MNSFRPAKKLKRVYFRFGEPPFVLLSIFIFVAYKQKWNAIEVNKVLIEAKKKDYKHLVNILRSCSM